MLIDLRTEGLNVYFLCPFIGCFCLIGASFTSMQSKFGKFPILQQIIKSVSEILAIIPYLISLKIQKESFFYSDKNQELKNKDKNELVYDNNDKGKSEINIYQGIILGFVSFMKSYLISLGAHLFDIKFSLYLMCTNIFFLPFLQKFLLNDKIYKNQIASIIIFFVLDIIYIVIISFDDLLKYNFWQLIFIIFSNLFFCFEITYEKKILKETFISFYKLCSIIGVLYLIFNIIYSIVTSIIEYNIESDNKDKIYLFNYRLYLEIVDDHVLVEIILVFVFLILNAVYYILQFLTIKYLSQNHVLITYIMYAIYNSILIKFEETDYENLTFIFSIVFNIICFFSLFIFLGIIQLNFFGISQDTSFKVGLRSDVDKYMQSFSTDDNDNDENSIQFEANTSELESI